MPLLQSGAIPKFGDSRPDLRRLGPGPLSDLVDDVKSFAFEVDSQISLIRELNRSINYSRASKCHPGHGLAGFYYRQDRDQRRRGQLQFHSDSKAGPCEKRHQQVGSCDLTAIDLVDASGLDSWMAGRIGRLVREISHASVTGK